VNKRGQGMSTNTIVLLIIAVIVLVVLILGFTIGWKKITPWISNQNVKDVVGACSAACATGGTYDFCGVERQLIDEEKNKFIASCAVFSLVDNFKKYGVEGCSINCEEPCADIAVGEEVGKKIDTSALDKSIHYDVSSLANDLIDPANPTGPAKSCVILLKK